LADNRNNSNPDYGYKRNNMPHRTRIKPQGDDNSKQESTDEKINGNAIANYFGQNSYLISSLKLMLETGYFWGCQIRFNCDL
jgi:hypothetical protein